MSNMTLKEFAKLLPRAVKKVVPQENCIQLFMEKGTNSIEATVHALNEKYYAYYDASRNMIEIMVDVKDGVGEIRRRKEEQNA